MLTQGYDLTTAVGASSTALCHVGYIVNSRR